LGRLAAPNPHHVSLISNRIYAVEGFGEAKPPQKLVFLARYGGRAAVASQKIKDFGGLTAIQASHEQQP